MNVADPIDGSTATPAALRRPGIDAQVRAWVRWGWPAFCSNSIQAKAITRPTATAGCANVSCRCVRSCLGPRNRECHEARNAFYGCGISTRDGRRRDVARAPRAPAWIACLRHNARLAPRRVLCAEIIALKLRRLPVGATKKLPAF
jgi:hypothetical protein